MDPADVPEAPAELIDLFRDAETRAYGEDVDADYSTIFARALGVVLAENERQVREKVAEDLLAVDPVEWALAGQSAGLDAARIARGSCSLCGGTGIVPGSEDYDMAVHMHNPSTGEPCDCVLRGETS
jgi:hypothetical protein